jgi:rhodanese-related sulfurtransferase
MQLRTTLFAIGFAGLAATVLGCSRSRADAFTTLTVDQVEHLLRAPDVRVFDANTRDTFEDGHVPGATFIDTKTLAGALPKDKSTRLVFYCKSPS